MGDQASERSEASLVRFDLSGLFTGLRLLSVDLASVTSPLLLNSASPLHKSVVQVHFNASTPRKSVFMQVGFTHPLRQPFCTESLSDVVESNLDDTFQAIFQRSDLLLAVASTLTQAPPIHSPELHGPNLLLQ